MTHYYNYQQTMRSEEIYSSNVFNNTITDVVNNPSKHITKSSTNFQDLKLYKLLSEL